MKSLYSLVSCVFSFVVSAFSERSFQMKTQMVVTAVAVVAGVFGGVGFAQDQSAVLDVPYIHQVQDIGVDGRNMCVSTSAGMLVEGYGLQPVNASSFKGWYVYNGYGDFFDFSGENYTTRLAGDWNGFMVAGAHGFIATELTNGSWVGDRDRLEMYLENHGLETDVKYSDLFSAIQAEINAGRPVLARFPIGDSGGHYVLVTGVAGPNLVVVNDPNGNKYQIGWGTTESNGKNVIYNITDSRTQFSWIVTARPKARGWYPDDSLMVNDSSNRGHAVTPRYSWNGLERQDYQFLYRTRDSQGSVYERSYIHGNGPGNTIRGWDPAVSPAIVHAYNSYGRAGNVGYPTTQVTHSLNGQNWGSIWAQVFNGGALGECAFIYDPDNQDRKAYPLQNKFWQWYRDNSGPNYVMPNGFPLGSPISNEAYWKTDAPLSYMGPEAKQEFENGYLYWDGANVFVMEYVSKDSFHIAGAGGSMPLTLFVWPLSNSQEYFDIQGGIDLGDDGWYVIFQDGVQMVATRLRDATINNLTPGSTHTYWVAIVDRVYGVLEQSSAITLTLPPPADFYIDVTLTSENYTRIIIVNNRFPYAYAYAIYRNGMEIARTSGTEYSDILLNYNTSYTYKVAALTASNLVLGWTYEVSLTTLSLPQNPPPPPPVQNPSVPLAIAKIGFVEPPPYCVNGYANAFFIAQNITSNTVYVKRFSVEGQFTDPHDGHVYERNWKAIEFDPPLAMNPYDTYRYQNDNAGWPFPGYPLPGLIKAYAVIQGVVGQYQITQALPDESATFEFNVVYPPPLVRQSNHVPSMEVLTPNPTNNDEVVIKIMDSNNDELASLPTEMTLSLDGSVIRTFDVPELALYESFSIGANIGRLSAGIHILRLTVDSTFEIGESREDDNVVELSLTVTSVPRPNYAVTIQPLPGPLYNYQDINVLVEIANTGEWEAPANELDITLAASSEEYVSGSSLEPKVFAIPILAHGETIILTSVFRTQYPTTFTISANADSGNAVAESNEADNEDPVSLEIVSPLTVLPKPRFVFSHAEDYIYADGHRALWYEFDCLNWQEYPNLIFANDLGVTCGASTGAARTWVNIFGLRSDNTRFYIYGFCGLKEAQDLNLVWFGISYGASLPPNVIVTLEDQKDGIVLESDPISIPPPPPPLGDAWDPADDLGLGAVAITNPAATEHAHGPHSLSATDTYDWFKVYLTTGRNYNFNSIGGTGDDYAELYSNSAGTIRVAYNDDSGGNMQFSFAYAPAATGWYYLRVRAYSVGNACSYSLKYRDLGAIPPPPVNDAWDPLDNTLGGATTVANPTAIEQSNGTHTLSSTDFYDYFRAYLIGGRSYNFNTAGGTGDNYGELYKGGILVASNDDSGGGYQFSFTYKPTSSGWCYVRVRQYSSGASCRYYLKYRDLGP